MDTATPGANDRRHFDLLLEIQRRVNQERSMARLPGVVMQTVSELMEADRSTLFLLDHQTMELRACFAQGVEPGKAIVVPLRMGLIGTAILQRQTLNVVNAWEHPFFFADIDAVTGYRTDSLLVTPIISPADGRVLGGLELLNKRSGRFTDADETIAEDAARWLAARLDRPDPDRAEVSAKMDALRKWIDFDRATVFRVDADQGRLFAVHADGANGVEISMNMRLGIAGFVALTGEPLLIPDAHADSRFDASYDKRTGYRTHSLLCVPLKNAAGEVIGVMQVINRRDCLDRHGCTFTAADLDLLSCVAGTVAIALENAIMFEESELQFRSLLDTLAASIDARDCLTAGHSLRVAQIARGIARTLDFTDHDIDLLEVAAILHDYGKIGIDDTVLKKEGKLEADEFSHMKTHASMSFDILDRIRFARKYRSVPLIASSHHENIDGTGYPRGLKAQEIPFMTKILSVADVFEALTADRHYREGMPLAKAMEIVENGIGTKFEGLIVDALKRYLDNGGKAELALPER
jgi:HD-GYP domain-containing protein (c-di-GMP phosphodiesterase class II)/putative methionine-R-sulfoxide reductase with GAF domain